jgi:predicted transcriptional regulator
MQEDIHMTRSKLEIYLDILGVLAHHGSLKFTNIRQKANYHANDLKGYLEFLVQRGFITKRTVEGGRIAYSITMKGITVFKHFSHIKAQLCLA